MGNKSKRLGVKNGRGSKKYKIPTARRRWKGARPDPNLADKMKKHAERRRNARQFHYQQGVIRQAGRERFDLGLVLDRPKIIEIAWRQRLSYHECLEEIAAAA